MSCPFLCRSPVLVRRILDAPRRTRSQHRLHPSSSSERNGRLLLLYPTTATFFIHFSLIHIYKTSFLLSLGPYSASLHQPIQSSISGRPPRESHLTRSDPVLARPHRSSLLSGHHHHHRRLCQHHKPQNVSGLFFTLHIIFTIHSLRLR